MNTGAIAWQAGDPALHRSIERALARAFASSEPIHETARRSLYRAALAGDPSAPALATDIVGKVFHAKSGVRALPNAFKRRAGWSAAQREYRALVRANASGLPVPRPLAYGRAPSGAEVLVTAHVPGTALLEVLASETFDLARWNEIRPALAASLRDLHASGLRHGDLHGGNLRLSEGRVFLFDFQRARTLRGESDRLADLAQLEFSLLRAGASDAMCQMLRAELSVGAELDAALIRFTRDHQRGRRRRRLRIGRDWRRIETGPRTRGVHLDTIDPELVASLYAATQSADQRDGTRATRVVEIRHTPRVRVHEIATPDRVFVAKQVVPGHVFRAVADRVRGSAGARAFRRGSADGLVSDRAARPLAYLDEPRDQPSAARGSWLLMERVGRQDLDRCVPEDARQARRIARALGFWLAAQHASGLGHRDLKGGNIRLEIASDGSESQPRFWLIDLQDLTGPAPVDEAARITALAQLNASLADEAFSAADRRAALDAYHARLPFHRPLEVIRREILQQSLARQHRFRAADCELAQRR